MTLVPTSGPALEPVTLEAAKAHMRITGSSEDLLIASLITAARVHIEYTLSRALITQTWSYFLDAWPKSALLELPLTPVQSIDAIRVLAAGDVVETIGADRYLLDGPATPPRLVCKAGHWASAMPQPAYSGKGIEVSFIAGYGDQPADVPEPLRHSILLLVAHWFERREAVEIGHPAMPLPAMVGDLLSPFREVRL
jgi:uncharacterized phiE125 gp8 family phage protein